MSDVNPCGEVYVKQLSQDFRALNAHLLICRRIEDVIGRDALMSRITAMADALDAARDERNRDKAALLTAEGEILDARADVARLREGVRESAHAVAQARDKAARLRATMTGAVQFYRNGGSVFDAIERIDAALGEGT